MQDAVDKDIENTVQGGRGNSDSTGDFSHRLNFGGGRRLPVIRQSESAECGLACLAMIAGYHGQHIDLPTLRQRFPLSLKGITLAKLIDIAQSLGFASRPLRFDLEELGKLQTPSILHWDLDHFVVLRAVSKRVAIIHDPAVGER
jgi:ATP-binding cassette subfamily B protein RaxB